MVPTGDAVPTVTHRHQPFRQGGPGSRISTAGGAWLVLCSHAVVCAGQGYLAEQFKAAVPVPEEPWERMLRERRWALAAETLPDRLGRCLLRCEQR